MKQAQRGDISDVFELDDKFALVKVTEVKPKGYRPFEEVKAQIRPQVVKQKKKAILSRRMNAALQSTGFDGLPQALGTELRSQSNLSFTTESVPGVGADPTFTGTVFGLAEGKTSGVVEGENAAFVVRVTTMNEPAELTASKRAEIRKELLKERRKQVSNQWLAALKEEATIKDQRQFQ
jgi:peptidylprolyl isomerase/peptidyl-prolyl cis-trans isomerase D